MNEHIGDDAELYALGVLDDAERARLDGHLATCADCSRVIGEAERAALALENVTWVAHAKPRKNQTSAWAKMATAAALILFAVSAELGIQNHTLSQNTRGDDVALATLATSHFLHATFVPTTPGVSPSKAIYARDGAWTYVIVDGDAEGWHVLGKMGATVQEIASLQARGLTSTAFTKPSAKYDALELENATGQIVATVKLVYPASP